MRICPKCNGAGIQFVQGTVFGGPCASCMGTGREREPAFDLPPGVHQLPDLPRDERIKRAQEMVNEVIALRRVADAARAVEAKLHAEARQANCDIVNDEHEQLRIALINLDSTSAKDPK